MSTDGWVRHAVSTDRDLWRVCRRTRACSLTLRCSATPSPQVALPLLPFLLPFMVAKLPFVEVTMTLTAVTRPIVEAMLPFMAAALTFAEAGRRGGA